MRTLVLTCLCVGLLLSAGAKTATAQPKPGPEHEHLKQFVGEWDATIKMGDMESKGSAVYEMVPGGFWVISTFKGSIVGTQFEGRGVDGYDPIKKKYVSSWVDSMTPNMLLMEGTSDQAGKKITQSGAMIGPDGQPQKVKAVSEFKDKDTFVFTMYNVGDGKDKQEFQITYKRKK